VRVWARSWLASRSTLKPKTIRSYESLLESRILPAFEDWPLAAVRPSKVQAWVDAMAKEGLSPSRIRQAHVVLSELLDAAFRDDRIARNPARRVKLPTLRRDDAPCFEPSVVEQIAGAMPEPYDVLVRILGQLGPRFGEAAALRRRSVNLVTRRLVIEESLAEISGELVFGTTKTHARRRVPLTADLAAALEDHLAERVADRSDALVFTGPRGGPLRHSMFYGRLWRPTLKRLGLPAVGLHVLRHSAAAGMISAGASAKARSAAFTLTTYGHLFDADLDDVAARIGSVPREARNHSGNAALRALPS
jgi:integrase